MKLRTRIIAGFLAVAIIPAALLSLLLYVYVDSSYENLSLRRSQAMVRSFEFFLDNQLQGLETLANRHCDDKELVIGLLDLPQRAEALEAWLQQRIQNGEFQFALARSRVAGEVVMAQAQELNGLMRNYAYPPPFKREQQSAAGLLRLGGGREATVAAAAIVPVYHRGELVGELLVGRLLHDLLVDYQLDQFDLAGLMLIADGNILLARADEALAEALPGIAALDLGKGLANVELGERDYLISGRRLTGLAGGDVGEIKLAFDASDYSSGQTKLLRIFALLLLGAIGFSVLVGLIYSRHISRPVTEMSQAARKIAAGQIPPRVIYLHDDEIGDLAAGINKLTDDLRTTENQLRQSEQIAAWQMFARQTAHELRNFLMPLATTAGRLQRWADAGAVEGGKLAPAVQEISAEINRMRRLLAAFSDFAKLPRPRPKKVDLKKLLQELKTAFAGQLQQGALDFAVSDDLEPVWCDPDQIRQVLLNLIANSYQADASVVQVKAEQDAGGVWFRIIDDGKGVAPEVDPFAPLYSTKERGSGLGLAIARRIVVDHGGEISFQDNPTGGAIFKFYLPGGSR